MAKHRVIKLGSVVKDRATELTGTITHWTMDMGGHVDYGFQPNNLLNPETGTPVNSVWLEPERFEELPPEIFEEVDVPIEILGKVIKDKASGFKGMAMAFIHHLHGCFHVVIQPRGTLPKTNSIIAVREFDFGQCVYEDGTPVDITKVYGEERPDSPMSHPPLD